ncbi:MAG: hypothetical protein CMG74_00115 [Candidatus Marinimicrobia bacterium]|nr:hypothetical protein [Candidatus Neomarinimicrobiota bacterium]|tara:strand:- start:30152 stop:31831 length:1680 start_codon:yes stop_codon:yes gene_type:complete
MDRNTLLAFLLIALVLIFTPYYMELVSPPPAVAQDSLAIENMQDYEPPNPEIKTSNLTRQTTEQKAVFLSPQSAETEKVYKIETNLYNASISSKHGGSLVSFETINFTNEDSSFLNLINNINKTNLSIRYKDIDGNNIDLGVPWAPEMKYFDGPISKPTTFSFFLRTGKNKKIKKSLTFYPDRYIIDINIDMSEISDNVFAGTYSLGWYGGLEKTEKNTQDDLLYFYSYVFQGGELVDLKVGSGESNSMNFIGSTDWVATRTKYFIASILPSNPGDVVSAYLSGNNNGKEIYDISLSLPASTSSSLRLYLGPLEYERIKLVGRNLESVMNLGFWIIRPISKGVLWLLKKMNQYISNYGVVLIVFSVLIKILVYPLTKKSYESTAAMQLLAPEISKIREKLKNNPQKLNQATMKLYKDRGVNPLGGCLPMLLQMPLLFALFQVFRTTIELRAEPFVFWIKDLSAPDTIFNLPFTIPLYGSQVAVLPIIMVISMFIQQRMMSGGVEQQPQQKTMQYFMTVFFYILFNSFPSGLNLYYTLFNILTILQQKLISPSSLKTGTG